MEFTAFEFYVLRAMVWFTVGGLAVMTVSLGLLMVLYAPKK